MSITTLFTTQELEAIRRGVELGFPRDRILHFLLLTEWDEKKTLRMLLGDTEKVRANVEAAVAAAEEPEKAGDAGAAEEPEKPEKGAQPEKGAKPARLTTAHGYVVLRTPESLKHAQGWHSCTWRTLCRRLGLEGSVVGRLAELNIHLDIAETEDEARSIWTRQNNPMPVHPQRWKYS